MKFKTKDIELQHFKKDPVLKMRVKKEKEYWLNQKNFIFFLDDKKNKKKN